MICPVLTGADGLLPPLSGFADLSLQFACSYAALLLSP